MKKLFLFAACAMLAGPVYAQSVTEKTAERSSTAVQTTPATFFRAATFNVLGADQEHICRAFASKAPDKFVDVAWRPAVAREG